MIDNQELLYWKNKLKLWMLLHNFSDVAIAVQHCANRCELYQKTGGCGDFDLHLRADIGKDGQLWVAESTNDDGWCVEFIKNE
jgi:hypothetical protein